ncbi:MAG: ABC transporter permease [Bryobacteraceae bacterium]|nr:ABC transporter permease [Bryobacteraceae bacterium]
MAIWQDVRFAARMMARSPGFTAVAVAALALGIGVNATVFSLVNAVLIKGLPFDRGDRIMHLSMADPTRDRFTVSVHYLDYKDWRAQAKSFEDLAGFNGATMNLADGANPPERYRGATVTTNAFEILGVKPVLGRGFRAEDANPGAPPVILLGDVVFQNRYAGDAGVVGRTVRVNSVPATVIGVMPPGFRFPTTADAWMPVVETGSLLKRTDSSLDVFGRLRDGVGVEEARAEMKVITTALGSQYRESRNLVATIKTFNEQFNGGEIRIIFLALLGAVGFVLLIACANVANLLMSRAFARHREISVRAALGASRWRVIRQMLVESVMLGLLGGVLGLGIAAAGTRAFALAVSQVDKPYWVDFSMDYMVFAYLLAICVGTGLLFGLLPAWHSSKVDLNEALKEGSRGSTSSRRRLSSVLVAGELALALILLIGAGLMIRTFMNTYRLHVGTSTTDLLFMRLVIDEAKYKQDEQRRDLIERLTAKVNAIPGVRNAALASHAPMFGAFSMPLLLDGQVEPESDRLPRASVLSVGPGYFETMAVPVLRGRAFDAADGESGRQNVIVNQRFAEKHFAGREAVGGRVRLTFQEKPTWFHIVGVTADIRQNGPKRPDTEPVIYMPYRQHPARGLVILAKINGNPADAASAFRKQVQAVDPDLPVYDLMPYEQQLDKQRWAFRVFGSLFAAFASIALMIAAVGLYGVMAFAVAQRTQEIGVRIALGASASEVLRMVLTQGAKPLAAGLLLGLAGAYGITRVLRTLLIGVSPTDPLTYGAISALLVAVALLACYIPARRASRVDPLVALRYE